MKKSFPRYFVHVSGFTNGGFIVCDGDYSCFSISSSGEKEWFSSSLGICLANVQNGSWKELTEQEAFAMIEKKDPKKETGYALAGRLTNGFSWNDSELRLVIDCMKSVIDFLEARGKSQDTVFALRLQIESFERMKRDREEVIRITYEN